MAKTPLTRDRALAAAMALADNNGLSAVTMRRLAKELNVEAMSVYHHIPNKEALLDGMVDRVYSEVSKPEPGDEWRSAMQDRAKSLRDALVRHPWAVGLLDSRTSPGPETLKHLDANIGCLRENGFSWEMTAHAYSVIDAYVFGFAIQQVQMPFESGEETQALAADMVAAMEDAYPQLSAFALSHVMKPGYDYASEFDYGLELILSGLEQDLVNHDSD